MALGLDRIDARFAMPRADLVGVLDTARGALSDSNTATEARVTAALARQLSHSIPVDRPLARPLAARAVDIARTLDEPATLASCLLAQHDALWTPGTASARAEIAAEIAEHLLRTRQAALALLDGDIETGDRLSAEAAMLGESVGDTDTGNVRMSQRLEIVRARNQPAELRDMAATTSLSCDALVTFGRPALAGVRSTCATSKDSKILARCWPIPAANCQHWTLPAVLAPN